MFTPMVVPLICLVFCALMAIRATRLLTAALWLIAVSVFTSITFYLYGGLSLAVVELSVGAGLVAVLLLFVISIAGDEVIQLQPIVPRWVAAGCAAAILLLLLTVPIPLADTVPVEGDLAVMLWEQRGADVLLQLALIFIGVLTIMALLTEVRATHPASAVSVLHETPEFLEIEEELHPELEKEGVL